MGTAYLAFCAAGILIGIVVAKRFRVLIVLPIIVLLGLAGFGLELAQAHMIRAAGLAAILAALGVDIGYPVGTAFWHSRTFLSRRGRSALPIVKKAGLSSDRW